MKLNRNNYEEYFILYLDNELDSEGRREVEAFVKQNPDLKAELDMLIQSKLTPDAEISFGEKGSLMRFDSSSISLSNYEEWLTSYIDDELTEGERRDVEVFVAGNPAIKRELNLLQQTKLHPETIVFPNKESLYHREEKARVISVKWWRIAAAAILLLGISTTVVITLNNKRVNNGEPTTGIPKTEKPGSNDSIKQPQNVAPTNEQTATVIERKDEPKGIKEPRNTIFAKQNNKPEDKKQDSQVKNEEPPLAINSKVDKPTSEDTNLVGDNTAVNDGGSMVNDSSIEAGLTIDKPKNLDGIVTPVDTQPSYAVESSNKGIRGFLRKVTRTIEKRTNIKATDDDDRLLVAGLAIKL